MTTRPDHRFCSWGMYAFSDTLREIWSALFTEMKPALARTFQLSRQLRFDCDAATLNHPSLLIGQTCGYPLIKSYRDTLQPLCVPYST